MRKFESWNFRTSDSENKDSENDQYRNLSEESVKKTSPAYLVFPWNGEPFKRPDGINENAVPAFLIYPAFDNSSSQNEPILQTLCSNCHNFIDCTDIYCRFCGTKVCGENPFDNQNDWEEQSCSGLGYPWNHAGSSSLETPPEIEPAIGVLYGPPDLKGIIEDSGESTGEDEFEYGEFL